MSAGSQPDWYIGWLEGALRLMPPWEVRIGGFEIPNPFFPGVLLPGHHVHAVVRLAVDRGVVHQGLREHHLLDRPRDRPVRSALGVAVLAFYVVLFFAGGNDVIAAHFDLSVELGDVRVPGAAVRAAGRVGLRHVPALQGALERATAIAPEQLAVLERTAEGGYVDDAEELSPLPDPMTRPGRLAGQAFAAGLEDPADERDARAPRRR